MRGKHPYFLVQGILPLASFQLVPTIAIHGQSAQGVIAQVTGWLGHHWLSAAALGEAVGLITAIAAVVGARAQLTTAKAQLMTLRDGQIAAEREQAREQMRAERGKVLEGMRQRWITGDLKKSLTGAEPMPLWCRRRPGLVEEPVPRALPLDFSPPRLPARESILKTFDDARSLLITGEPVAGKTTLLLQLAEDMLDRAEHDERQPVPLVIKLSDWTWRQSLGVTWSQYTDKEMTWRESPLSSLAARKLTADYGISPETAWSWISEHSVALLLDDLTMVSDRAAFVTAINGYLKDNGLARVAVCCRSDGARELRGRPEQTWRGDRRVRLRMKEAIELIPPTDSQVIDYLTHVVDGTGWLAPDIGAALAAAPDLREFLRSPQRISALRKGYGELAEHGQVPAGPQQWPARLAAAYIAGIYRQYPLSSWNTGYDWEQATQWLAWLASALRERGTTRFALTDLTEQWLPAPHGQPSSVAESLLRRCAAIRPLRPYAICALLARSGVVPMRYTAFLGTMTYCQLLRRKGNHYAFAHCLLRDYLADQHLARYANTPRRRASTPSR